MASEALKQAMADLAVSGDAPALGAPLPPSRLGTQDHWNQVYEREVKMFNEIGDEGEVWFGEDAAQDMVDWAEEHFPRLDGRILDVGTGNGQLLFALSAAGYTTLTGVDYSPLSIELAQSILAARVASSEHTVSSPPPAFFTADILDVALGRPVPHVTPAAGDEKWDLITDKGTYDAVCLADELREGKSLQELYVASIARLLPRGGLFLITSCNWTQKELEAAFVTPETGLTVHSTVPRASFQFGGSTGSSITTVAFEKQ
ncbi:Protein-lysine N-methyltransferase efm4 [Rhodotorula kratochvilovae]